MTSTRWSYDWMYSPLDRRSHIVIVRRFEGDVLKSMIEARGTHQRRFYVIRRFKSGVRAKAIGRFLSIEDAQTACGDLSRQSVV